MKKGKISRTRFFDIYESDKGKIAELEEERELLERKLRKEREGHFLKQEKVREKKKDFLRPHQIKITPEKSGNKFIKFIKRLFTKNIDKKIKYLTEDIESEAKKIEEEKSMMKRGK